MPDYRARRLRQLSTDAERRMWSALRDRRLVRYKFRRQHPISGFIVDFACTEHGLVVEIDGGQHGSAIDVARTASLEALGWRVIRFWNNEVLSNTSGIVQAILLALQTS